MFGKRKKALFLVLPALMVFLLAAGAMAASKDEGAGNAKAAVHESKGGGHEAGEEGGWGKTDTYKVMNFVVLAAGLVWVFLKVGRPALAGRIESIRKELADLEARKESAKAELAGYEARIAGLVQESSRIVADYVRQGETVRDKILAEAALSADRLSEQARRHMEHEIKEAKARLQAEIVEKALAVSEQIIRANINSDDQDRLVAEFLEKVVLQ
jgi:F-type H+-transporting ATPase subunit b